MSALPFHRRHGTRLALRYLVALMLVVIFVFPVYWLFIISFKTPDEIFAFPPVWYPNSIQFANYAVLFKDGDAATVGNSLILASVSTFFAMILGTIAAYSLVRFKTGGENLAVWIISQRMMPPVAIPNCSAAKRPARSAPVWAPEITFSRPGYGSIGSPSKFIRTNRNSK